jgi:DnaJ-class molecular chaperone
MTDIRKVNDEEAAHAMICQQCDGAGRHWEHWGWDTYDFDAVECKACNGTGKRIVESQ